MEGSKIFRLITDRFIDLVCFRILLLIVQIDVSEIENVNVINNETEDNTKLLAADYLGLKDTLVDPVEFKTPTIIDKDLFKKKERELIYLPCTKPGE